MNFYDRTHANNLLQQIHMANTNKDNMVVIFRLWIPSLFLPVFLAFMGIFNILAWLPFIYCSLRIILFLSSETAKVKQSKSEYYELAKDKLRQQPNDNYLRENALKAGREYYKSLRNGQLSIYDEQAINNDLAAVAPVSQTNNTVQLNKNKADENSQSDIVAKSEKLKQLKE